MSKLKLPIIIVIVLAAAGAGLFASGMLGGSSGPTKKHVLEPIALAEPFTINLADTDSARLLAFNIALKLEPMDEAHWAAFTGAGGGGHGGSTGPGPGETKVSTYPRFYDAVLTVSSTFTYDDLKTENGKAELKAALLDRFHEIAEQDEATYGKSAGAEDPAHVGPPYHVEDLDFTKFVVQ
jgi:flagellar basal body-associated protein FliL